MAGKYGRVFNFSPGPAVLPLSVLERAREELLNYAGSGIGVMELSHRSPQFEEILDRTEKLLRQALTIPSNYRVLFMTGGGTNQFSIIPTSFAHSGMIANYLLSGFWSERAFNEAKKFAPVHVAGTTKENEYRSVPRSVSLSEQPAYLHYTSNNTIYGTQYHFRPECPADVPLITDASSDILSRPIDVSAHGMIYAAAQKNAGIAGVTIVIVREDLLARTPADLPLMQSYRTFSENRSLFNTAPTFPIYMSMLVLEWLLAEGGVAEMERRAQERAKLVYDCIDRHPLYQGFASPESRSLMNLTFHLTRPELTDTLITEAEQRGLSTIRGYRTMGGIRVSLYNAAPLEGVQELVKFLDEFATRI